LGDDIPVINMADSDYLLKLAEDHMEAGRFAEAIPLLLHLRDLHRGEDSYVMKLAWAYHDNGQLAEALACLEELFEKEVSRRIFTGFAFDELVRIYKRENMTDRLVAICERAVAAQPDDFSLLGDLAEAYLKAEMAAEAVSVFQRMIALDPRESVVYCRMGDALIALDDEEGAERAYEKAISLDPQDTGLYYSRLADAFLKADRLASAERAIRKGIAFDDTKPAFHLALGDILLAGGDTEGAFSAYEEAVRLFEGAAGAYYQRLGNSLMKKSLPAEACRAFRLAVAAEPANPLYLLRLAEAYLADGLYEEAQEALRRAQNL